MFCVNQFSHLFSPRFLPQIFSQIFSVQWILHAISDSCGTMKETSTQVYSVHHLIEPWYFEAGNLRDVLQVRQSECGTDEFRKSVSSHSVYSSCSSTIKLPPWAVNEEENSFKGKNIPLVHVAQGFSTGARQAAWWVPNCPHLEECSAFLVPVH